MGSKLGRLWKSLVSAEAVEGIANASDGLADASEKVFALAETLKDKENLKDTKVKELVEKIPTLLEALNSPLGQVVKSSVPFLPIATGLIQFAVKVNEKEPTVTETVAIVAQVAYLESIKEILASQSIFSDDTTQQSQQVQKQLKKLEDLEISDRQARDTLVCFHQSQLAEAFNQVLSIKLRETGIPQSEVGIWVKRVAMNTQRYMIIALVDSQSGVQQLRDWYSSGGREEKEKYRSIDEYLEKIEQLPQDYVFKEKFNFQDIYVPLQGILLDKNGKETSSANKFVLEEWAQKFIIDSEESAKVLFIQAGAGRGKSVFCRMFADWVRQNLHPLLTPIIIRLRDIENFEQSLVQTLSNVLSNCDFVSSDNGWLTDNNTQYLFLLDGFDELRMEGRASGGIERFIKQVGQFQEQFRGKETGHRVIMTGRPMALKGISFLPDNLERVKLLPMNDEIQQQWFKKWSEVVLLDDQDAAKEETEKFKAFLAAENCPTEINDELAREPLLLYLLGKLHREQAIKQEDFVDDDKATLPLKKMRDLREQLPDRETYLGQRQVDVYAGLNIMILLLELHRYGQSQNDDIKQKLTFYPCGQPNTEGELVDATLLRRLINYSDCVGDYGFRDTVGRFLEGANLSRANLSRANLSRAKLDGANLYGAYLNGAYLNRANLDGANLGGAHLGFANLDGANLGFANLDGANLDGADLQNIRWNSETDWTDVQGLDQARKVPEALKQQLSL